VIVIVVIVIVLIVVVIVTIIVVKFNNSIDSSNDIFISSINSNDKFNDRIETDQ